MAPATDKQIAFADSLIAEIADLTIKVDPENGPEGALAFTEVYRAEIRESDKRKASNTIDFLIGMRDDIRRRAREQGNARDVAEIPEGVHLNADGTYVKVQRSGAGNLYGKFAAIHRHDDDTVRVDWEYGGKRALAGLSADTLLDAEQAAAFGHLTGRCVFCSTALSDERSVSVGYGPTCADRHGLPWGEVADEVADAHTLFAGAA